MTIKILNSIKYIVTIMFLFVGIVYIFLGNKILKDFTLDKKKLYVPRDLKNITGSNEENLHINKNINGIIIVPIFFICSVCPTTWIPNSFCT